VMRLWFFLERRYGLTVGDWGKAQSRCGGHVRVRHNGLVKLGFLRANKYYWASLDWTAIQPNAAALLLLG
jgi:hypothetical protein